MSSQLSYVNIHLFIVSLQSLWEQLPAVTSDYILSKQTTLHLMCRRTEDLQFTRFGLILKKTVEKLHRKQQGEFSCVCLCWRLDLDANGGGKKKMQMWLYFKTFFVVFSFFFFEIL